ncbi:MAG: branched-chain amino acid aminotransferase [Crocinitomicaceae bacterium]|nr:branched-chain amino acid aminotransferase [Crocinitomicaceae bacterium]
MLDETLSIKINKTQNSKIKNVDWENLPFGKVFSDHMLVMNYADGQWGIPEIRPFESLSLHPATSAIHYGQSIFEGMKANRTDEGDVLLFRPDMNAKRFAESSERMCMPVIPEAIFTDLVKKIVDIDRDWIPNKEGYSLYIRPFMFATDDFIGIKPSDTYTFMIFTCPVGVYYSDPVNVKIEEHYTRAAYGGVGRAKTAGNYAASLYPAKKGNEEGFHQLIWTDGIEHKYIEESGTMNVMFIVDGKLITPAEDSDTILKGITKRSVVELAEHWGLAVEERKITVEEIVEALKEGRVTDAFGAGTAATIAPIAKIGFRGELYELPSVGSREVSNKISRYLNDLKVGKAEDVLNWCQSV